jgi:hypothetical protein
LFRSYCHVVDQRMCEENEISSLLIKRERERKHGERKKQIYIGKTLYHNIWKHLHDVIWRTGRNQRKFPQQHITPTIFNLEESLTHHSGNE